MKSDSRQKPSTGIVWLASYPKSGNTWTRTFLSNLLMVMSGEDEGVDINSLTRFSLGENFTKFYKHLQGFQPKAGDMEKVAAVRHRVQEAIANQFEGLIFVKTHNALLIDRGHSLLNFAVTSGAVYIVRNPLDVAISLAHHINGTLDQAIATMAATGFETPIDEERVHEVWGSWNQHVESWTRKPHEAIYVMRYEDMLENPGKTFRGLARHLLMNPTRSELALAIERSSFETLQRQEKAAGFKERPKHTDSFFREGRVGQWKEILTPEQVDRIVGDHARQMKRFGYLPT